MKTFNYGKQIVYQIIFQETLHTGPSSWKDLKVIWELIQRDYYHLRSCSGKQAYLSRREQNGIIKVV